MRFGASTFIWVSPFSNKTLGLVKKVREIGFDISAGDLTVHDGRIWHRAALSPLYGEASRRRVMYVPVVTGKYMPKDANSKTPFYHRLASKVQN